LLQAILDSTRALTSERDKLSTRTNALTVDLEEYFTVQALDKKIPRERWPYQPLRCDRQVRILLDLFEQHSVKATFFVLGWVAQRHPSLIREVHQRGHEIAAHSYWHKLVFDMTPEDFRADLIQVRDLLQDLTSASVIGYRAPTYSITRASLWAHDILAEEGFLYSSSIFPIHHDRYGIDDYPRYPQLLSPGGHSLWEFPITTLQLGKKNLPVSGGGYMRLLPARSIAAALAHINNHENQPTIIYLHPWEIDPEIPKFGQGAFQDFRGYMGIHKMLSKLEYLINVLHFSRVDTVLGLQ
jgi:polysaccharide deacetylase family protein (PEP-CTERM system associated)